MPLTGHPTAPPALLSPGAHLQDLEPALLPRMTHHYFQLKREDMMGSQAAYLCI